MTQERYQEAAEWAAIEARLLQNGQPMYHECAATCASVLSKLASGWVLVPGEPTITMQARLVDCATNTLEADTKDGIVAAVIAGYKAMIAAAPKP